MAAFAVAVKALLGARHVARPPGERYSKDADWETSLTAPKSAAGPRRKAGSRGRKARRGALRRWTWRLALVLVAVALVPAVLTPVYRVSWVHPTSTLMLADLVTLAGYDRRWVRLEDMGTAVVHSAMVSEDGRFCSHGGIDWDALNSVIEGAFSGTRTRGASTIPMQTTKNLFLWPGRSYLRKAIELPLALYVDFVLPKRRIMEIYLNIAEWGPNIYGVEAAAQHHFGVAARELTARQAALLAVTLPNPAERRPGSPTAGLNRLAATVEARARQAGDYVGCLARDTGQG